MANISFYGSHNAAYVVEENGKILLVLEVERFLNYKNSGLAQYLCPKVPDLVYLSKYIPQFMMSKLGIDKFETCYALNTDVIINGHHYLEKNIPSKKYEYGLHHRSHAAGTFYQSPYEEALIFSFDGGGNDGKFNIYHGTRKNSVQLLETIFNPNANDFHTYYDLGFPYMVFGEYLADIKYEGLGMGNLIYPGKIMGLASYGNVNEEWLPHFIEFYKSNPDGSHHGEWDDKGYYDFEPKINKLGEQIGVKFDTKSRLSNQVAYDVSATSQRAFEECFLEIAKPYFDSFPDIPICITGGCGLNIILNTRLIEEFKREVFVGPNPNDCGIALGLMLDNLRPQEPIDITYSGLELLDIDALGQYIQNVRVSFTSHVLDISELAKDIAAGKIIGVARGRAEHGARALGNRSIICNPSFPEMKDILNSKVKFREWFRPFAPICIKEESNKYFNITNNVNYDYMSFSPKVKENYRKTLPAITHIDGSSRLQTINKNQNSYLYEILKQFEKLSGFPILVNTSFNVKGKSILTHYQAALQNLDTTQLDGIILDGYYITK